MVKQLSNQTVLVVEDEPMIAMEIADELRAEGATLVGPTSSVAGAMKLLSDARIDCAILDIDLSGERSFPIAAALMSNNIPFTFVTAHTKATLPVTFINRPVLQKPWADFKLVETVVQLCGSTGKADA